MTNALIIGAYNNVTIKGLRMVGRPTRKWTATGRYRGNGRRRRGPQWYAAHGITVHGLPVPALIHNGGKP